MKKMSRIKGRLSLLFIAAILILCAGFLIAGCGNDPQQKTKNADVASFALDFSACPTAGTLGECTATLEGSDATPVASLAGRAISMEAWIESKSSTISGVIFSRMDSSAGAMLLVNNNQPKFTIRRAPVAGDVAFASRTPLSECVQIGVTSTECVVEAITQAGSTNTGVSATLTIPAPTSSAFSISAVTLQSSTPTTAFTDTTTNNVYTLASNASVISVPQTDIPASNPAADTFTISVTTIVANTPLNLVQDDWTHIAGAVTSEDQSSVSNSHNCQVDSDGNGTKQGAEQPHLAIYIDGALNNCATTGGTGIFANNPGGVNLTINGSQISTSDSPAYPSANRGNLNAVVDELRLWITARSVADIAACMYNELGVDGTCNRGDANLAAYYRLNEGEDVDITDFSGNGISGSLETADAQHFDTGWVLRTDSDTPAKAD